MSGDEKAHSRMIWAMPRIAALIVALAAGLVLAGWMGNVEFLKDMLHPGRIAMNPVTAILFVVTSICIWLLSDDPSASEGHRQSRRRWAVRLSLIVLTVALCRIGAYAGLWRFRLDTALFSNRLEGNVMAPNTALAFILIAISLIALDVRLKGAFYPAQPLVLTVAGIAGLSLVGYLYDIAAFYAMRGAIPMALNTAILFLLVSVGVMFCRPDREPLAMALSPTLGGVVARRLVPAAYAIPLLVGGGVLLGWKYQYWAPAFGMSLFVLAIIFFFNALIWWCARVIHIADDRRQHAADELRKSVVAERAALEQLRRAQSRLVQTEKLASLGQVVAGVAHEINNPLAYVSNNVAVLQRDIQGVCDLIALYTRGDDVLSQYDPNLLDKIQKQADHIDLKYTQSNFTPLMAASREGLRRIQQIVKNLRDFARLDESDLQEVDINGGIEATSAIVASRARNKRIEMQLELQPLPQVACYPAQINQVTMNLILNAIDACPESGTIRVRSALESNEVCIIVADTGPGVPPAIRDRVFDPFFTTKRQGEGTGLGLSIAYGIVNDHGGKIEIADQPGGGAIFTVRLPIRRPPSRPESVRAIA